MSLIGLIIFIVVLGLLFYVLSVIPIAQPFKNILVVIVCLIVIIVLLQWLGILGTGPLIIRR
jgi:hypothetical protein